MLPPQSTGEAAKDTVKILLTYTHPNHPCLEKASALNLMEVALVSLVATQYCNAARDSDLCARMRCAGCGWVAVVSRARVFVFTG